MSYNVKITVCKATDEGQKYLQQHMIEDITGKEFVCFEKQTLVSVTP